MCKKEKNGNETNEKMRRKNIIKNKKLYCENLKKNKKQIQNYFKYINFKNIIIFKTIMKNINKTFL